MVRFALLTDRIRGSVWSPVLLLVAVSTFGTQVLTDTIEEIQVEKRINCDYNFSSDVAKNGFFSSPNFPQPYPANVACNYQFHGSGKERIQIVFTDFDLYLATEEPSTKDCEEVDAVMAFVVINSNKDQSRIGRFGDTVKQRIDNYCGNQLPAQLMSNGPSFRVEFRSTRDSETARGFKAMYRFITNFGINAGVQDPRMGVCAFVYNSTISSNGTFSSPNWPGLYPRDTECHYFFHGKSDERVHITFTHFDIEGVPPCNSDTASDYVEFSNYQTVDRKMARHCGMKNPKTIESEGDFFRVTFKSNDRFDGTGFEAFYQFRKPEDSFSVKKMRGLAPSGATGSSCSIMLATVGRWWCSAAATLIISSLVSAVILNTVLLS